MLRIFENFIMKTDGIKPSLSQYKYVGTRVEGLMDGYGTLFYRGLDQKFFEGNFKKGYIYDKDSVCYDKNGEVTYRGIILFGIPYEDGAPIYL